MKKFVVCVLQISRELLDNLVFFVLIASIALQIAPDCMDAIPWWFFFYRRTSLVDKSARLDSSAYENAPDCSPFVHSVSTNPTGIQVL